MIWSILYKLMTNTSVFLYLIYYLKGVVLMTAISIDVYLGDFIAW